MISWSVISVACLPYDTGISNFLLLNMVFVFFNSLTMIVDGFVGESSSSNKL